MTKYNAKRVKLDGYTFDSQAEARRYKQLLMLEQAGAISDLTVHPRFLLINGFRHKGKKVRSVFYEADFQYYENGNQIVEDVKGVQTAVFKLKMKLFLDKYPTVEFRIVEAKDV